MGIYIFALRVFALHVRVNSWQMSLSEWLERRAEWHIHPRRSGQNPSRVDVHEEKFPSLCLKGKMGHVNYHKCYQCTSSTKIYHIRITCLLQLLFNIKHWTYLLNYISQVLTLTNLISTQENSYTEWFQVDIYILQITHSAIYFQTIVHKFMPSIIFITNR